MEIENHKLEGDNITFTQSPNHSGQFAEGNLDTLIIHYTAGSSVASAVRTLTDPNVKASAHVVVGRDGSITQLVPFDIIAWHAGRSAYGERTGFNEYSIGIEIDNAGELTKTVGGYKSWFGRNYDADDVIEAVHRNRTIPSFWQTYSEAQITAVYDLCDLLIGVYSITQILGHEEIAPRRKSDPGPAFPLDKMRDHLLLRDRDQDGAEAPEVASGTKGIVTASKLNVRADANRHAEIVASPLVKGTEVNVLREASGWYEIDYRARGWVKKDYIES